MSALNQSSEGCDWNSCHIMSSFQEEGTMPLVASLLAKRSGPPLKAKVGEHIPNGVSSPGFGTWRCSFGPRVWVRTRGLHRPSSVAHSRCSRLTYLFSVTSAEILSVTSWRSWKSRGSDVPTTLQKTTKKGHNGYESIVLSS
jgi:hypothetical protein